MVHRGSTGREFPERDGTKLVPSRPGNLGRDFRENRDKNSLKKQSVFTGEMVLVLD